MEIVIPPRDHDAQSAYRYTWDENGEVTKVTRVRNSIISARRARQTIQWPYQNLSPSESQRPPSIPTIAALTGRRKTWQARSAQDDDRDTIISPIEIPDYVINYLRGETPETIARRQRERHNDASLAANARRKLGGGSVTDSEPRSPPASADEEQHILASAWEKPRRPRWRRLGEGWRGGAALAALLCLLILLVGLISLIVLGVKGGFAAGGGGTTTVFAGSCGTASHIDWGVHALISVFAVALIAVANYVFQVLSSPTGTELAVAHSKMRWLDIGIPSIRNFRAISGGRVLLSVIILVAALATQVLYNAVIFTSLPSADYEALFVTPSFLTGAPFSNATANNEADLSRIDILALQDLASRNQLANLTSAQCSEEFGGLFDKDFRAVLVVVTDTDSPGSSLVQTWTSSAAFSSAAGSSSPARSPRQLSVGGSDVAYCLAQPDEAQTCIVSANILILGITVILGVVTLAVTTWVLFMSSFEPLVTLGDALASFLQEPDPATRGACLMTKQDVWQGRWGLREAKYWVPSNHYWFRTPSLPRWALFSFFWSTPAVLAAVALTLTTRADPDGVLSPFGAASPHAVCLLPDGTPAPAAVVIAALPQLLLVALYLATNSLLTTFFLSHESSLYSLGTARPLRVSAGPRGAQTASLFLTLPRLWSSILILLFAALSFVLGQAVFVTALGPAPGGPLVLGFSGVALLVFLALAVALAVLVLALGCRRAPPAVLVNGQAVGNPLVLAAGSCSAVLGARCHGLPADARDAWCRPVMWGVVVRYPADGEAAVGHCTYSARTAAQLDISKSYA